jgi:hypothetical protein
MNISASKALLLTTVFALVGCGGGGGGGGIASTPTPTPPPPAAVAIIPAAASSQQFAVEGAAHSFQGDPAPRLGDSDQLQVRYIQSSNSYEVQLPQSQAWIPVSQVSTSPDAFAGPGVNLWLRSSGYQYSRLIEWSSNNSIYGHEALGMATQAGGVPVTGSATYAGQILGATPETHSTDDVHIGGAIALSFDFGAGSLAGSISPILYVDFTPYSPDVLTFSNTVYSTGSTTFSGTFTTNLAGLNSFSGLFTGPQAQELIGKFAFPYRSPVNGQTFQADGAFVAAR